MKKEISKKELIYQETGIKKYSTNHKNIFIYDVLKGWGWIPSILKNQKDDRSDWFNQQSIIIEHSEFIDGKFCGNNKIHYNGLNDFELN